MVFKVICNRRTARSKNAASDLTKEEYKDWMAVHKNIPVVAKLTGQGICKAVILMSEVTATGKEDYKQGEDGTKECEPLRSNKEVQQTLEML